MSTILKQPHLIFASHEAAEAQAKVLREAEAAAGLGEKDYFTYTAVQTTDGRWVVEARDVEDNYFLGYM